MKWLVGEVVLFLMDKYLVVYDWFVGGGFIFVDICFYVYIYVVEEGGFKLFCYLVIEVWLVWVVV